MMQNNQSTNLLFNDLYYIEDNNDKKLYRIKENLDVETINNDSILEIMNRHMKIIQYIDNYTYTNNKITNNPIIAKKKYELMII